MSPSAALTGTKGKALPLVQGNYHVSTTATFPYLQSLSRTLRPRQPTPPTHISCLPL